MNRLVILAFLIVSAQLFFNYITSNNVEQPGMDDQTQKEIGLLSLLKKIEDTYSYYSTPEHLKELFVVPYRPKPTNRLRDKFQSKIYKDPESGEKVSMHVVDLNKDQGNDGSDSKSAKYVHKRSKSNKPLKAERNRQKSSAQFIKEEEADNEISEAKEVEQYNKDLVYFAKSKKPRDPRPSSVKFYIGQTVRHTQDGYHGVVVGWDDKCKAPEWWLHRHGYYTDVEQEGHFDEPHYLVLVDEETDNEGALYYLPQNHLTFAGGVTIRSNHLDVYFTRYSSDTQQYVPKDWLRERYPND